ncbi:restriction endonuclease subunit S [Salinisphaera sp. RV14]|uniref:restriction endonuclease subunit S n=1 Tax=unclassified Salinisphaera TaxID=2649847 RepID=UPI003F85DE58
MSAEPFITEHLDLWTGAVTTKSTNRHGSNGKVEFSGIQNLRELILELAVRGRLVLQDSEEEPASGLLRKILSQTTQSTKTKSADTPDAVPASEIPYDKPLGWEWSSLGAVSSYIQRGKGPKYADNGKVRVVSQKCIRWAGLDLSKARLITDQSLDSYKPERFLKNHDLLWNSTGTGTVGRLTCVSNLDDSAIVADSHVTVIRLKLLDERFIHAYLSSPTIQNRIDPHHPTSLVSGTTKQVELNTSSVKSLIVPIPPLSEQHRIVHKVDELMALCDRLEQQTRDQHAAHETLVDALLGTLTQSKDADELAENWARLAAHFDSLFTTENSIERLKQTVLQLAVMGRLVPQTSSEQAGNIFLSKIEKKRANPPNYTRSGREKPLPAPRTTDHPFALPEGWALTRLDNVTQIQSGIAKGKKHNGVQTIMSPYLRVANVQRGKLNLQDIKEIEVTEKDAERYLLQPRDLLITEGGDWDKVGRTAIWDGSINPMIHQNHVFRARLILEEQNERWLEIYLNSAFAKQYFADSSKQTTNLASINKTQLRSCIVPLPPAEEQDRIIHKTDELIAICDRLKTSMKRSGETGLEMADIVVEQAIH